MKHTRSMKSVTATEDERENLNKDRKKKYKKVANETVRGKKRMKMIS